MAPTPALPLSTPTALPHRRTRKSGLLWVSSARHYLCSAIICCEVLCWLVARLGANWPLPLIKGNRLCGSHVSSLRRCPFPIATARLRSLMHCLFIAQATTMTLGKCQAPHNAGLLKRPACSCMRASSAAYPSTMLQPATPAGDALACLRPTGAVAMQGPEGH